jgi:hypothetical protein
MLLDPDKLKVWRTSAVLENYRELPDSRVSIPSEASVEIAREFVNENQK